MIFMIQANQSHWDLQLFQYQLWKNMVKSKKNGQIWLMFQVVESFCLLPGWKQQKTNLFWKVWTRKERKNLLESLAVSYFGQRFLGQCTFWPDTFVYKSDIWANIFKRFFFLPSQFLRREEKFRFKCLWPK